MLSSSFAIPTYPAVSAAGRARRCMDGADTIIERAREGDQAAFETLFRRHRGDVTRLVYRLLGPHHEVEDVVQDVFVHVYRSLGSFRGDARFSTWLYRLTVNVVRMHQRRKRSRPRLVDALATEPTEADVVHPHSPIGPDGAVERGERIRALHRLVQALTEKKRTVLVLHDLEGVPAKEIARIVEAPVLTVRTRLFYARKELYAALAADPATAAVIGELAGAPPGGRAGDGDADGADDDHTRSGPRGVGTRTPPRRARSGGSE